ncbi:MAG: CYTH domain-containing protein [Caldithrix sp.]|nr:CYTH domain-containing protein [Caldithrix sp.]
MALEIERKFLVKGTSWQSLAQPQIYRQGYVYSDDKQTVRVRMIGQRAFLTLKREKSNVTRLEFEYPIPPEDAMQMLSDMCTYGKIEKYRYKIEFGDLIWEVDEFFGDNEGLVVAEVELKDENQKIVKPQWIGKEISQDRRYYNAYLAKNPYKFWED